MTGKCTVCGARIRSTRSKTLCMRHYWKLRRLAAKPRFELNAMVAETEHTKKLIAFLLDDQPNDGDVAEVQRSDALRSE